MVPKFFSVREAGLLYNLFHYKLHLNEFKLRWRSDITFLNMSDYINKINIRVFRKLLSLCVLTQNKKYSDLPARDLQYFAYVVFQRTNVYHDPFSRITVLQNTHTTDINV